MTTLLCILLSALLARRLALFWFAGVFCCVLAAAAIERPEAPERKVRFNAEENSLTVLRLVLSRRGVQLRCKSAVAKTALYM